MAASQDDDDFPGQDLIGAVGWTGDPTELEQHLDGCLRNYEKNKSANWPALLAFALIAREAWSRVGLAAETPPDDLFDKIDPVAPVVVPWWAVQAIAIAWGRHVTEGGMTLDQAFGVAGSGGKGKHGQKKKADKIVRDIGYALEVAWQLPHAGSKVSLAIEEVACRWKVSEGTIRGAWRRYGKAAKRDADAARAARSARADEESPPMSK